MDTTMNSMTRTKINPTQPAGLKRVLDVGSGGQGTSKLHRIFQGWQCLRLDIDERVKPDIVGSIVDMKTKVPDRSYDAIWSSHNLEHLYPHDVKPALAEFARVLKPTGFALITCPDLLQIAEQMLKQEVDKPAYISPAGPISPIDMLYGHSASLARGNLYMAHHTGFTASRIGPMILQAGFAEVWIASGKSFDLWAVAFLKNADRGEVRKLLSGTDQKFLIPQ
jgi:SAM-dependent methyltransferase